MHRLPVRTWVHAYLWGLKPVLRVVGNHPQNVRNLPMRDWNSSMRCWRWISIGVRSLLYEGLKQRKVIIFQLQCCVCSLPMRIETWGCSRLDMAKVKFVAYLWGIETFLVRRQKCLCANVRSLPMRDWCNLLIEFWHSVRHLWGIETITTIPIEKLKQ